MRRRVLWLLAGSTMGVAAWLALMRPFPREAPTPTPAPPPGPETAVLQVEAAVEDLRARAKSATGEVAPAGADDPPPAAMDWPWLQQRADAGDARAACELARRLDACRQAEMARRFVDSRVEMAAHRESLPDRSVADIAGLDAMGAGAAQQCGEVPVPLQAQEWRYLLQAALAGHEDSMSRFVMFPPIDERRPLDYLDALVAYRDHALPFVDELMRRGNPDGLAAAMMVASGSPLIADNPLAERDDEAMLQLAVALQSVRGEPGTWRIIEAAEGALDAAAIQRARNAGLRMATGFRDAPAEASDEACAGTWQPVAATADTATRR